MQKMHDRPKKERMLRAYLNSDLVPLGFKGNPLSHLKYREPFELTLHSLSNYTYAKFVLESVRHQFLNYNASFTANELSCYVKHKTNLYVYLAGLDEKVRWKVNTRNRKRLQKKLENIDKETLSLVNSYNNLVTRFYFTTRDFDIMLLFFTFHADTYIPYVREFGAHSLTLINTSKLAKDLLEKWNDKNMDDPHFAAMLITAFGQFCRSIPAGMINKEESKNGGNGLGRVLFNEMDQTAWELLRAITLEKVTLEDVCAAAEIAGRVLDPKRLDVQFKLHQLYGTSCDLNLDCGAFRMEASPFVEKPIGVPAGMCEIAVWPKDPKIVSALGSIKNPSFEHADGAIALAAVSFSKCHSHLLVEEIQSDVPQLIKSSGVNDARLGSVVRKWPEIAFSAVCEFARKNAFKEFYVATPYRVIDRYHGHMHPLKSKVYFETLEKLGGQLVYDDESELCGWMDRERQHYYRFAV